MLINPKQLLPSQDYLKPKTVRYILECIKNGELEKLPPTPIVRKDEGGNLIAIDGHNLIAVKAHLNEDVEVHLATSPDDGLTPDSDANNQRNNDFKEKFETVLNDRDGLKVDGVNTFNDLLAKYPDLFE